MKHLFTLLSFYLLSTHFSTAQNWALPTSRWQYLCNCPLGPCFNYKCYDLEVEKDTVVQSVPCAKIVSTQGALYRFPLYAYSARDTGYIYLNGGFHPMLYFNANTGDTLTFYNDTTLYGQFNAPTFARGRVDSINTLTIQNQNLKVFYISRIDNPGVIKRLRYAEKIGFLSTYGNVFYPTFVNVIDAESAGVCNYGDSTITNYWLYTPDQCYPTGIDRIEISNSLQLTPNPANDHIEISTELRNYKVQISDMTGRKYDCAIKENTIDIRILGDGVYMLLLSTDGVSVTRRVVKQ